MFRKLLILSLAAGLSLPAAAQTIRSYITRADRSDLFTPQEKTIQFSPQRQERGNYIVIDPRQTYQRIDGFGYALTGGSAEHLMKMSAEARKAVLQELFDPQKGIGGEIPQHHVTAPVAGNADDETVDGRSNSDLRLSRAVRWSSVP